MSTTTLKGIEFTEETHDGRRTAMVGRSAAGEVVGFAYRTSRDGTYGWAVVIGAEGEPADDALHTKTKAREVIASEATATSDEDLIAAGESLIKKAAAADDKRKSEERAASRALDEEGERRTDEDGRLIVHIWDDLGMDMFALRRKWERERAEPVTKRAGGPFGRKDARERVAALIDGRSQFMTIEDARLLCEVAYSPLDRARQSGAEEVTSTIQLWHADRNQARAERFRTALDDIEAGRPHERVEPGF